MTDRSSTAERRELLAKAAPGPLRRRSKGSPYIDLVTANSNDDAPLVTVHEAGCSGDLANRHNEATATAALIAAAVNDYARHLDMEDALAVEMEKARLMPSTPGLALYAALARIQKVLTGDTPHGK